MNESNLSKSECDEDDGNYECDEDNWKSLNVWLLSQILPKRSGDPNLKKSTK